MSSMKMEQVLQLWIKAILAHFQLWIKAILAHFRLCF